MIRAFALLPLALLSACSSPSAPPENRQAESPLATPLLPLFIRTETGTHAFKVEVAQTPEEQAQGLMFRKELAPDRGMLFPMEPPRIASFWMKNTLIPLDMLFIRADGRVAYIAANVAPYSDTPVSAGIPVIAVLELAGGRAAELSIGTGAHVSWGDCAMPGVHPDASAGRHSFCP